MDELKVVTLEDVAVLVDKELDEGLDDELSAVRTALRKAMLELEQELEPAEFAKISGVVIRGANTVAQLLKTKRILSGNAADEMLGNIATIIEELFVENEWEA